jgi:4-hydroxy-tetrahydrodipicolinate synthase
MTVTFGGVGVALVTLFDAAGNLDAGATAEHAARLVGLGMRHLVVCGSTGEAWALTPEERVRLIREVRAAVPASVPVIAGTGAPSAAEAVRLTADARAAGADTLLVLSPPGSQELVEYYARVVEAAGDLPVLAYHFPTVSAPGIPLEVLPDLPVAGIKDSGQDTERIRVEVTRWTGSVFVGSTATLELARSLGAAGAILGIANAEPETCVAAFAGDASAQRALVERSREAERGFPQGIKDMTATRFGTSTVVRGSR